jgi:nucleoside-diphosphate-sugar epimerase
MASDYPEHTAAARDCRIVETAAKDFYGAGYQDVQDRFPMITATVEDLGWKPVVDMEQSLRAIFESYRSKVGEARSLTNESV